MAVFIVGDVQGCFDCLTALLNKGGFRKGIDQLFFAGDLVNRGSQSLESLKFAIEANAQSVLGNHDLHFLACYLDENNLKKNDTLDDILQSDELEELVQWVRQRPLLCRDSSGRWIISHAGIYPFWSVKEAFAYAREIEDQLRGDQWQDLVLNLYGNRPKIWHKNLKGIDRSRFIINSFTRMRFCNAKGKLDFKHKGPPGTHPDERFKPWFEFHNDTHTEQLVFGHWSTLGFMQIGKLHAIDAGCLWGGHLVMLKQDDSEVCLFRFKC